MAPQNTFATNATSETITQDRIEKNNLDGKTPPAIDRIIAAVEGRISPVWPLNDYVAVNPYAGLADREFLATREYLRTLTDLELFMPVDYYRQQFQQGVITRDEISAAVDELVADGVECAEQIDVNQVVALLRESTPPSPTSDSEFLKASNPNRTLFTLTELVDQRQGLNWCRTVIEEISKLCASHYDRGHAPWPSSSGKRSLFESWKSSLRHDRTMEILGVSEFRCFVAELPRNVDQAITELLQRASIPLELWEDFLLCIAMTIPGWSAWTKYQSLEAAKKHVDPDSDLGGLLAIRLAYDVALSEHSGLDTDWQSIADRHIANRGHDTVPDHADLLRYALLRSTEIAYRNRMIGTLAGAPLQSSPDVQERKLAQVVFCIDVRSERIRRHLEASSQEIETFGFAGFFGVPMEFHSLGENKGCSNVPVLISPQFRVHEEICSEPEATETATNKRVLLRGIRKSWKEFQTSAISMFAFVETTGLLYGIKLLARSLGWSPKSNPRYDGMNWDKRAKLSPSLDGLQSQGVSQSDQADLAETVLRGIGITADFSRLVVFCGHGSQVENNPLKAGLDCGACGGHSGEPNARFAAKLLNQTHIRESLRDRGIVIPDQTHFVAALHNTTTDKIEFFDQHLIPESHRGDVEDVQCLALEASKNTRHERLPSLSSRDAHDLQRRSIDWSEVRPEWGLAGNAAFIAAPRELSRHAPLHGRSFLHSYDFRRDPEFRVLEQIMTAPMVVANWINMQYYASTVDPIHFGSGNKTVHNVVGRFGVFSGNGGDLQTGLPWQSVHNGKEYQHHPLRLLVMLAAPRKSIERILASHKSVSDLVTNGWIQLVAIEDDGKFYRFTERQDWEEVNNTNPFF